MYTYNGDGVTQLIVALASRRAVFTGRYRYHFDTRCLALTSFFESNESVIRVASYELVQLCDTLLSIIRSIVH